MDKTEQTSAQSQTVDARRRANMKIAQNVLLIWLDKNIDEKKEDCCNTITELRRFVNNINMFIDGQDCIKFINTITDNKACIIISGSLGQHIVPQVHHMSQVDSIFIFCSNRKWHEQWAKEWTKVKGVFTDIVPICKALKQASQQCEQNAISISFVVTGNDASNKHLDRLDPMFMYTQIMNEILLTIKFEQQHFNEYIDHCRAVFDDNEEELKNVDRLEQKYRNETPIWWYTNDCFLYPMLNRALRMGDMDIIVKMGFFISDLHRQIEKLYKEQFGNNQTVEIFTVYRGQGLSKTDFNHLKNTTGGLISFNNFLSTSKNRNVSLHFARNSLTDPDSIGILFVMTIDSSKSTTPFASINSVSYFQDKEDEVLFSMHTIFRIYSVKSMDDNHRLVQVDLTLTTENDQDLCKLTDYIRKETYPNEKGWLRLGLMLHKMGQSDKAQQVYEVLLNQATNEKQKGSIYCLLGSIKDDRGEYEDAVIFYEKTLEIYKKNFPSNHPHLASTYNNIGVTYKNMGEYSKALSSYKKALEIQQQSSHPNYPDIAMTLCNIGVAYKVIGEYSKALLYHEKALKIRQQSLPSNHPDLASSYNNIGSLYARMGQHGKALPYFEKDFEISQKSLPPNHPDLAISYNNIGAIHEHMGNYSKALSCYEHAADIGQQSLPSNHHDLKDYRKNIERVKKKL